MEALYFDMNMIMNKYLLPFFRISGLAASAPIFSSKLIPKKIKIGMAILITLPVALAIPEFKPINLMSFPGALKIGEQILIGAAMGFVLQLIMQVFLIGGQFTARQAGLGFASMVDPQTGVSVPLVSQFYLMMSSLVFLSIDGHLYLIRSLTESFYSLPIDQSNLSADKFWIIVSWSKIIFSGAVKLALPIAVAMLLVNLALGVMARAAPQLNIFSVGFPVMITTGLALIAALLPVFNTYIKDFFDQGFLLIDALFLGGAHG